MKAALIRFIFHKGLLLFLMFLQHFGKNSQIILSLCLSAHTLIGIPGDIKSSSTKCVELLTELALFSHNCSTSSLTLNNEVTISLLLGSPFCINLCLKS